MAVTGADCRLFPRNELMAVSWEVALQCLCGSAASVQRIRCSNTEGHLKGLPLLNLSTSLPLVEHVALAVQVLPV